ncbi:hypothetical protein quinque_014949 [Culex quinquefasciatus]
MAGGGSISGGTTTTTTTLLEVPPGSPQPTSPPNHHHGGGIITISKPKPAAIGGSSSTSTAAQVKMCGYLKKKRNKMGGWRKMYFILQNQLLLSYSSKDDYEKKLAPFKDIINLVPGTVIIPTTGPRFTIETNSKVLYTFRCDDHKSCSEWITALLDSLKGDGGGGSGDKKYSHLSKGLHGGNLHHQLSHRSLSSLSSSSSSASSTASCYATDDPSRWPSRRSGGCSSSIQNLHSSPSSTTASWPHFPHRTCSTALPATATTSKLANWSSCPSEWEREEVIRSSRY